MRLHYFQHVPFEDPGYIQEWAQKKNIRISATHGYRDWQVPAAADIDFLVIMGGPMGVVDEGKYPWLAAEKKYIEGAIKLGKPVLGVCLGAQMIASVLGARVYANKYKEIGWFKVKPRGDTASSLWSIQGKKDFFAFHWHGDTFDLPSGAVHVASSEACPHQAFVYDDRVLGLQFHLESTLEGIKRLIQNCREDMKKGDFVQTEAQILEISPGYLPTTHTLMDAVLNGLFSIA